MRPQHENPLIDAALCFKNQHNHSSSDLEMHTVEIQCHLSTKPVKW